MKNHTLKAISYGNKLNESSQRPYVVVHLLTYHYLSLYHPL